MMELALLHSVYIFLDAYLCVARLGGGITPLREMLVLMYRHQLLSWEFQQALNGIHPDDVLQEHNLKSIFAKGSTNGELVAA